MYTCILSYYNLLYVHIHSEAVKLFGALINHELLESVDTDGT